MLISLIRCFNKKRENGIIFSNIFFNNYCLFEFPKATKVSVQKVLKFILKF